MSDWSGRGGGGAGDDRSGSGDGSDRDGIGDEGGRDGAGVRLESRRGQLVLVAAGVIAVGLLPVVLAYTQLGYAGMAATEPTATPSTTDATRAIERAAFDASAPAQGVRPWTARGPVAERVADRFDARVASIETGGVERGVVHEIERNQSAAADWTSANCPGGPNRQFGPCEAEAGVVVQERGGDVHVVAIAVDLRTVTDGAVHNGTYLLDAEIGGRVD